MCSIILPYLSTSPISHLSSASSSDDDMSDAASKKEEDHLPLPPPTPYLPPHLSIFQQQQQQHLLLPSPVTPQHHPVHHAHPPPLPHPPPHPPQPAVPSSFPFPLPSLSLFQQQHGQHYEHSDTKLPLFQNIPKMCGWCRTLDTPQWRLGQSSGSSEMGTLCNACGINYRRALSKTRGLLDLDALARSMGPSRPSIQKSLKRLRRSAFSSSSKRLNVPALPFSPSPTSPMSPPPVPSRFHPVPTQKYEPNLPLLPLPYPTSAINASSPSHNIQPHQQSLPPRLPPIHELLRHLAPAHPPHPQHPQQEQHPQYQLAPQPPPPGPPARFG